MRIIQITKPEEPRQEKHYRAEDGEGIWEVHEIIYSPFRPSYISFTYCRKTGDSCEEEKATGIQNCD